MPAKEELPLANDKTDELLSNMSSSSILLRNGRHRRANSKLIFQHDVRVGNASASRDNASATAAPP